MRINPKQRGDLIIYLGRYELFILWKARLNLAAYSVIITSLQPSRQFTFRASSGHPTLANGGSWVSLAAIISP
jgi:hypothetical protein